MVILLLEKQNDLLQLTKSMDDIVLVNEDNVKELRLRLHEHAIATVNELAKQR